MITFLTIGIGVIKSAISELNKVWFICIPGILLKSLPNVYIDLYSGDFTTTLDTELIGDSIIYGFIGTIVLLMIVGKLAIMLRDTLIAKYESENP